MPQQCSRLRSTRNGHPESDTVPPPSAAHRQSQPMLANRRSARSLEWVECHRPHSPAAAAISSPNATSTSRKDI